MGQVGISIVHDVNHGSGLSTATSRYVLGAIVDLVRLLNGPLLHDVLHCHALVCSSLLAAHHPMTSAHPHLHLLNHSRGSCIHYMH